MTSKFNLFITIISFYLLNAIKSAPRRQQQHVQLAEQPTGDTSREIRPEINGET